jgi:hypothetical protein
MYCQKCNDIHFDGEKCHPAFKIYPFEDNVILEEECQTIHAKNAHLALERYGKDYNTRYDYDLMNTQITVAVESESGKRQKYTIKSEPDVYYWIEKVKEA